MNENINEPAFGNDATPDDLMSSFKGRSVKSIVVFTIIAHVIIVFGTSVPYFIGLVGAKKVSEANEEERMKMAVKEATASLRAIAEQHGLNAKDVTDQFAANKPKDSEASPKEPEKKQEPVATEPTPVKPKSEIEKELDVKENGPDLPPIPESDENLFK
jgi:hypothetical protein